MVVGFVDHGGLFEWRYESSVKSVVCFDDHELQLDYQIEKPHQFCKHLQPVCYDQLIPTEIVLKSICCL